MSKYTTEVRFICEQLSGMGESKGYFDVDKIIEKARPKIFDFNYPIFDNDYKPVLESKILMHYYTREISEETYSLWKLRLRAKLNEIMPYYNQLYNSELIKFNPLWDTDLLTDRDIKQDNTHEDETVTDNTDVKNIKDKEQNSGNDVRTLGGQDVTNIVSEENNTLSGSDVDRIGGQDVNTLGGQDVISTTGQDVGTLGGQDVTTLGGEDTTTLNSNDITNTWDLYSDTPQGSIKGIEGAEDSPSLGDNGYLTNARHVFGDTLGTNSDSTTEYGRTDTTDYGRTNTTEYGKVDTTEYGQTNTTDYGKTDTTEYGKVSDTDVERTDTIEYGKTDTLDYGKIRDYDSNINDKFDSNVKTDGTAHDTIDYLERVTGYRGRNPSESLLKFRDTFLNIDELIIKELRLLFFNIW
ncbi:MAG: hypothetical protein J6T10_00300 [Methanobrevibacter sp.]|nr:hypothetical protein [Methanobrevibacter sp.]